MFLLTSRGLMSYYLLQWCTSVRHGVVSRLWHPCWVWLQVKQSRDVVRGERGLKLSTRESSKAQSGVKLLCKYLLWFEVQRLLPVHCAVQGWCTGLSPWPHSDITKPSLCHQITLPPEWSLLVREWSGPFSSTRLWAQWSSLPLPLPPAGIAEPIAGVGKGLAPQIKVAISKPCLILPSVREQLTAKTLSTG